jgi:DNA modification methylase
MTVRILHGDCRQVLPSLADESVHCIVTSPPYWGLRSYLPAGHALKALEIGSEPTVEAWVATMVAVMRECRRVLRKDGTLWLNLGDSYAGDRGAAWGPSAASAQARAMVDSRRRDDERIPRNDCRMPGLKPKDLVGQPWRVAFALQADGWWLRQEIIWNKPNPMPESTRDRCTKSHEHVFLLSKAERYFYNFEATQEPVTGGAHARGPGNVRNVKLADSLEADRDGEHRTKGGLVAYAERKRAERAAAGKVPRGWDTSVGGGTGHRAKAGRYAGNGVGFGHGFDADPKPRVVGVNPKAGDREVAGKQNESFSAAVVDTVDSRNPRSVWTIPTHPFKGAHFATFPPELARRCLVAGCPPGGTVLDPFGGSGTVGLVADGLGMNAVLIDLDERNVPMARERISADAPLFAQVEAA